MTGLDGNHQVGDPSHVAHHNLLDQALAANLGASRQLAGATAATRYVGGTTTGAPTSGAFLVGDHVIAQDGHAWVCTVAGSPGTWGDAGAAGVSGALAVRATQQPLRSGYYTFTTPANSASAAALTNGAFRSTPWWCPTTATLTRIGMEVTVAGSIGAVLRVGIYTDDGTGYPGALLLDAGTIDGTVVAVAEITISQSVQAGQLYWVGAALQGAPTTAPTIRTSAAPPFPPVLRIGTAMPAANAQQYGYTDFTATGALASTFSTAVSGSAIAPRLFVKAA